MAEDLVKLLLEADDDDDEPLKQAFPEIYDRPGVWIPKDAPRDATVGSGVTIRNSQGEVVSRSRNLAGIRAYIGRNLVDRVKVYPADNREGILEIWFDNGNYCQTRWASFSVLKSALRTWRNLYGANLEIEWNEAGKIGYRNPALIESEDFDLKADVVSNDLPEDRVYSLAEIKATNPGFFSRSNNRFFGTRKIFKLGNFIILYNVKIDPRNPAMDMRNFRAYEYCYSVNSGEFRLLGYKNTRDLDDIKDMIRLENNPSRLRYIQ